MSENPETTQNDSEAHLAEEARRAIQARASPEGIVTILFTDIVESTRIRQRLGDQAAQERFRQHNQVVRAQIAKRGGFEVKTRGDGFMVAFSDVGAGLACAVAIQQAVAEDNEQHPNERIEMRMGLNCGQAIREEEDFFGGAVIVAARLEALAKGGQILVSEAVRVLAGLPEGIGYVRQGRRQLKGLEGSYDVWRVPWREEQPSVLARLWAKPAVRVIAPVLLLAAIGGGVAGGVVLSQSGGGGGVDSTGALQEVTTHMDLEATLQIMSGNCLSEDLVLTGTWEGEVTGDLRGHYTGVHEGTAYAAEGCRLFFVTVAFTITDSDGNTLYGTVEGPGQSTFTRVGGPIANLAAGQVFTITGGTGIYEGAAGTGTCDFLGVSELNPDGSTNVQGEGDCTYTLSTGGAVLTSEPVIVQMVGSTSEVTVFGSTGEAPTTVGLAVVYRNTREKPQRGLSLRLPEPEGAQILAAALGEEQPVSAGERVWRLPDLAPGELQRFEFTLQFLAADTRTVPLVVEIEGDGLDGPARSDPITIQVAQ